MNTLKILLCRFLGFFWIHLYVHSSAHAEHNIVPFKSLIFFMQPAKRIFRISKHQRQTLFYLPCLTVNLYELTATHAAIPRSRALRQVRPIGLTEIHWRVLRKRVKAQWIVFNYETLDLYSYTQIVCTWGIFKKIK